MGFDSDIRDYFLLRMSEIEDLGRIHKYHPTHAVSEAEFLEFFTHKGKYRGWTISRNGAPAEPTGGTVYGVEHTYLFTGYYALDKDRSPEKLANDHADQLRELFESDPNLGGNAGETMPLSILPGNPWVRFGGVGCYRIQCSMIVMQYR